MFCNKSPIINRHNSPCSIQQIYHLYKHRTLCAPITSILSRQQHYSNKMTSNPTCPDCGRPFKTRTGLSIHRNECPIRETQTKQQQRRYPSGPQAKDRGVLAIAILEMTIIGWTVSFILDHVLPQPKLTSLRSHWMAAAHRSRKQGPR